MILRKLRNSYGELNPRQLIRMPKPPDPFPLGKIQKRYLLRKFPYTHKFSHLYDLSDSIVEKNLSDLFVNKLQIFFFMFAQFNTKKGNTNKTTNSHAFTSFIEANVSLSNRHTLHLNHINVVYQIQQLRAGCLWSYMH